MRKLFKKPLKLTSLLTLPILWGIFIVAYFSYNLWRPASITWPQYSKSSLAVVDIGGGNWKVWRTVSAVVASGISDPATRQIAAWGNLVRYSLGYFWGTYAVSLSASPGLRLYPRWQFDLQYPAAQTELRKNFAPHLEKILTEMELRGTRYLVVPVPNKVSIEREWLPAKLPPRDRFALLKTNEVEDARKVYGEFCAIRPKRTLNLFETFHNFHETNPQQNLFMPLDSHWTSFGIALTAKAIVEKLHEDFPELPQAHIQYSHTERGFRRDPHTYGWTEVLPQFALLNFPELRWNEGFYDLGSAKSNFANPSIKRIILPGSSYSERLSALKFSLGQVLSRALNIEVIEAHTRGSAAGGFKRLLDNHFTFRPGDFVIWEIPTEFAIGKYNNVRLAPEYYAGLLKR